MPVFEFHDFVSSQVPVCSCT